MAGVSGGIAAAAWRGVSIGIVRSKLARSSSNEKALRRFWRGAGGGVSAASTPPLACSGIKTTLAAWREGSAKACIKTRFGVYLRFGAAPAPALRRAKSGGGASIRKKALKK
jgi:hypothetical protein